MGWDGKGGSEGGNIRCKKKKGKKGKIKNYPALTAHHTVTILEERKKGIHRLSYPSLVHQ